MRCVLRFMVVFSLQRIKSEDKLHLIWYDYKINVGCIKRRSDELIKMCVCVWEKVTTGQAFVVISRYTRYKKRAFKWTTVTITSCKHKINVVWGKNRVRSNYYVNITNSGIPKKDKPKTIRDKRKITNKGPNVLFQFFGWLNNFLDEK